MQQIRDFCIDAVAGTVGGVTGVLVGSPLDVIKTRLQAGAPGQTMMQVARQMIAKEGPGAFFKGSLVASLGQAPNNFLSFGHYGWALRLVEEAHRRSLHLSPDDAFQRPLWHVYIAGCWAGTTQSLALAPFEHIKVQQQLMVSSSGSAEAAGSSSSSQGLTMSAAARAIYASGGVWRGLMRGWVATAWRDIPTFGLYFSAFEWTKEWYAARLARQQQEEGLAAPVAGAGAASASTISTTAAAAPAASAAGDDVDDDGLGASVVAAASAAAKAAVAGIAAGPSSPAGLHTAMPELEPLATGSSGGSGCDVVFSSGGAGTGPAPSPLSSSALAPPALAQPIMYPDWVLLLGGALAGVASWTLAVPADVLKSNIQGSPMGTPASQLRLLTVARRLHAEHGASVFFRGFVPCIIRSMPVNAVTFLVYEWSLAGIRRAVGGVGAGGGDQMR